MDRAQVKARRAFLCQENRKYPVDWMIQIPRVQWPENHPPYFAVFRSRDFLVQVFQEGDMIRLSINRTALTREGDWKGDISWEQLQCIKGWCGYGDYDAVEIFPPDTDVVNLTNMRHLWVFPIGYRLPFPWRNGKNSGHRLGLAALAITDGVHNA